MQINMLSLTTLQKVVAAGGDASEVFQLVWKYCR